MQCREIKELLSPYLDGALDPSEGEAVSAHLDACPDCRADWSTLVDALDTIKTLPELAPSPRFSVQVLERIVAASSQSKKKSGAAYFLKALNGGHWSRAFALAASLILTMGVTTLMYGAPGQWSKTLFLPQAAFNQTESRGSQGTSFLARSSSTGPTVNDRAPEAVSGGTGITQSPPGYVRDSYGPVAGSVDEAPPVEVPPDFQGIKRGSPNGQVIRKLEQWNGLPERMGKDREWLPLPAGTSSDPRTMAAPEGGAARQMAFGYKAASGTETARKVAHKITFSLKEVDPALAQGKIKDLAVSNGGRLLTEDYEHGRIALKVPADRYSIVLDEVMGMGNATLIQNGDQDVTDKFSNYEARIAELEAEAQKLQDTSATAAEPADQENLIRVREELNTVKKSLASLSGELAFATITIHLD